MTRKWPEKFANLIQTSVIHMSTKAQCACANRWAAAPILFEIQCKPFYIYTILMHFHDYSHFEKSFNIHCTLSWLWNISDKSIKCIFTRVVFITFTRPEIISLKFPICPWPQQPCIYHNCIYVQEHFAHLASLSQRLSMSSCQPWGGLSCQALK